MLSRVLVPLYGSPTMAQILPRLRQWWGGTGAVVHLLVVRPPIREVIRVEDRVIYLDELVRQGSQLAYDGVVVHRTIRFGDPVAETLAAAERHSVHLIALVGQSQSWPWRWIHRSLAEQLLAKSPAPVLVVPPASQPTPSPVLRYSGIQV